MAKTIILLDSFKRTYPSLKEELKVANLEMEETELREFLFEVYRELTDK